MINKIKQNIFQLHFREFGSCVYLIKLDNKNILIDTSSEINKQPLIDDLKELGLQPEDITTVILTHNHYDHNDNIELFSKDKIYDDNTIGNLQIPEFQIIKTPGHTKDSLCILYQDILFSGDTIFHNEGRGRTDLEGGNEQQILESIEELKKLDYKILCPGHI